MRSLIFWSIVAGSGCASSRGQEPVDLAEGVRLEDASWSVWIPAGFQPAEDALDALRAQSGETTELEEALEIAIAESSLFLNMTGGSPTLVAFTAYHVAGVCERMARRQQVGSAAGLLRLAGRCTVGPHAWTVSYDLPEDTETTVVFELCDDDYLWSVTAQGPTSWRREAEAYVAGLLERAKLERGLPRTEPADRAREDPVTPGSRSTLRTRGEGPWSRGRRS